MKKNYLMQWLLVLLLFLVGCRTETYSADDSANARKSIKFRVIPESEIPQIITTLKAKTNNFKVPLRNHASAHGKTETAFGDVVTSYIIESTDGSSQVYYTFPILPSSGNDTSDTYNLEVKTENAEVETAKVLVYEPAADWIVIGNNDYSVFSGNVSTYSLDGTLEGTVAYINGTGDCKPPCPDCPTTPQGPGNPNPPTNPGGGGTGGGGNNPPSNPGGDPGNPGTPSVPGGDGPPPTPPAPPNNPPSGPPTSNLCPVCAYVDPNTGNCLQWIQVVCGGSFTANRIAAPTCGQDKDPSGGGVVVTTQDDPCTRVKAKFANAKFKEKYDKINKPEIFNLDHETGSFERYPPKYSGLQSTFVDIENNIGTTDMSLPADKSGISGLMHSHQDEDANGYHPIKVFSPTDVRTFINFIMPQANSYAGSYTSAYSVVTTSGGNYMLQYTKATWPGSVNYETKEKWQTWYEREYKQLILDDNLTQPNVEKVFTRFIKEVANIDGLEVYKVTETTSSKLEYNGANQPVKSTPCP